MRRDLPLFIGNPNQHFCNSMERLEAFIDANNGRNDCYWSHNAVKSDRSAVLLRYIPFDFDSETDIETCRRDLLRLRTWVESKDRPQKMNILPVFSAGKGYHGYLEFSPILVKADHDLQAVYKGIQLTAVEEAGLETADPHLHGDHQRILRIPGTRHTKTGLFCNELPWQVVEEGVRACKRFSRAPRPALVLPQPSITAPAWMKAHGLAPREGGEGYGPAAAIVEYKGGDALVKNILPRMCIHNGIMQQRVNHVVRFEAALTMAMSGFDPQSITNFFVQSGREYGWFKIDRATTEQQVYQIWKNRGTYKLHSCGRLRSEGVCVGEVCPRFKEVFGNVAE